MSFDSRPSLPVCLLLAVSVSAIAAQAQVKIFRTDTREAALEGTADGIAVGPLGQLELSPAVERLAGLDEPFVFSAAATAKGWLLGTGSEGKVFHVGTGGVPELASTLSQSSVFAVLGRKDGTWLAAGSPDAVVYRIEKGKEPVAVLDAEATYVWDLAEDAKGRLLVATGLPGKILRLEGSRVETLWEGPDDHVRTLLARRDGSVWAGTAGQGRIVRLDADGSVRTLHDAAHPEVLAFAESIGGDGAAYVYAALLASEASLVDLSKSADEGDEDTVTPSGDVTVGSRGAGFQGPRSVVLRLRADGEFLGQSEKVAELTDETINSLFAKGQELWIGTGEVGALYRLRDDILVREQKLAERQIVALESSGGVLAAITTNGAAVYKVSAGSAGQGVYTSKVLDTEQPARFGVFRWRGEAGSDPAGPTKSGQGSGVDIEVRAGSSSEPDATWTDWTAVGRGAEPGADLPLHGVGNGRFVQWRAMLHGGSSDDSGSGPRIDSAELSYRQLNQAPTITSFAAKAAGQIVVSQNFNPTTTVFEPWSPNQQGIFVTLNEGGGGEVNTKTLWKRGWRTLEWKTSDANGDTLEYTLEVRPEGGESAWMPMVQELDQLYYNFDATVLPDGVYRFRLTASDSPSWPAADVLPAQKISEPVTIDHTPPRLASKSRSGAGESLTVRIEDELSPILGLEVSVDAGEWQELTPLDGLADGHTETLKVAIPEAADLLLLRAMDGSFNVVTWSLLSD